MQGKYYVYLHRDTLTNEIFYIGKGSGDRAYRKNNRNIRWDQRSQVNGFYVEIPKYFSEETDALDHEKELIEKYKDQLVNNLKASSHVLDLEFGYFNEILYVNPLSASGLSWKSRRGNYLKDAQAGSISKIGYWEVQLSGISYKVHRVVYLLSHTVIDKNKVIDHIDRNRKNNNITNLRETCRQTNAKNRTISDKNEFGIVGIRRTTNKASADGRAINYIVFVWPDFTGKELVKSFSIEKYGEVVALQKAVEFSKLPAELRSLQRESNLNFPGVHRSNKYSFIVLYREKAGSKRVHKYFPISQYDSEDSALEAAKAFKTGQNEKSKNGS